MSTLLKFPIPQKDDEKQKPMFSDKFDNGYIMSSRLYRKEVMPFLSDAARNVYVELENRINGFQKETDFVSYSQLQGDPELDGARTLGRATVAAGLKELLALGVISVVATGKQGTKSYKLNEISLKDRFSKKTSSETKPVQLVNQTSSETKPKLVQKRNSQYIKENIKINNEDNARENFVPQNRSMLQFIEYYPEDQKSYSLKELNSLYSVQNHFTTQAKVSFPNLSDDQIHDQLKKLAQWSVTAEKRSAQKWMTTWLNWIENFQKNPGKPTAKTTTAEKPKKAYHRFGQGSNYP